jgi:hypothetical protein
MHAMPPGKKDKRLSLVRSNNCGGDQRQLNNHGLIYNVSFSFFHLFICYHFPWLESAEKTPESAGGVTFHFEFSTATAAAHGKSTRRVRACR